MLNSNNIFKSLEYFSEINAFVWLLHCKEVYINVAQSWNYVNLLFFWFTLGHLFSEGKPAGFKGTVKE